MQNIFFLIFMYFSQWLIIFSYAKSIYEKRNKFSVLTTITLYAILMLTYRFLTTIEVLNIIFTLLCNVLCLYLGFKSTFKSAAFHGMILGIIQLVSEAVAVYIISWSFGLNNTSYTKNNVVYIIDVIISKILYFAISRLLLKFSNQENDVKSWGRWFSLAILPTSSLFIIIVMRILTNGQTFSFKESILGDNIYTLEYSALMLNFLHFKRHKNSKALCC